MGFAATIWLWGLLPWGALALWLLAGRTRRVRVPFLHLWRENAPPPPPKPALRVPPISLVLMLLGLLLALLAAGQPFWGQSGDDQPWRVVVDRGAATSAGADEPGYVSAAGELAGKLPAGVLMVIHVVPGEESVLSASDRLVADVRKIAPTGTATTEAVEGLSRRLLGQGRTPVLVLTRHATPPGATRVPPREAALNVGIEHAAVRRVGQRHLLLVRVRNDSSALSGELVVGGIRRAIELPPPGSAGQWVLEAGSALPLRVELAANGRDDFAGDNVWMIAEPASPVVRVAADAPAAVSRLRDSWQSLRGDGTATGADGAGEIVLAASALPEGVAGMVFEQAGAEVVEQRDVRVTLRDGFPGEIQWGALGDGAGPAPTGFDVLVQGPRGAMVAVASEPRRVWLRGDIQRFSRTTDFVVLFGRAMDYLGATRSQGGSGVIGHRPLRGELVDSAWRFDGRGLAPDARYLPGLWREGGETLAWNVAAPDLGAIDAAGGSAWREAVSRAWGAGRRGVSLAGPAIVLSIALFVVGLLLWPAASRPRAAFA